MNFNIPDLGIIDGSSGFRNLPSTTDGRFTSGEDGVKHIVCTGDGKVEFVAFEKMVATKDFDSVAKQLEHSRLVMEVLDQASKTL